MPWFFHVPRLPPDHPTRRQAPDRRLTLPLPRSTATALFYVKLAWAELGAARRGALLALLGLGSALMVFITSQNVVQLLAQLGKSTGA